MPGGMAVLVRPVLMPRLVLVLVLGLVLVLVPAAPLFLVFHRPGALALIC